MVSPSLLSDILGARRDKFGETDTASAARFTASSISPLNIVDSASLGTFSEGFASVLAEVSTSRRLEKP